MDDTSTVISPAPQEADDPPKLSKNALKKAAKAERYAAYKLERRAKEKEARKEKKRIHAEKRAAGELDDNDEHERGQKKKIKLDFGGRVVIDLGFDDKMTDKVCIYP
jgi:tRNA (guanine9-N1)-methyltransferase